MKTLKILVINPGSTSTKVAYFHDLACIAERKINHSNVELAQFKTISDELPMRVERVREFLMDEGVAAHELDVIVGRGGMLPPVRHGAYVVDEALVELLLERPAEHHASNLGAGIALYIARDGGGIPAYIYDSVAVDEMLPIARYSGVKGYPRQSFSHVLNTRAVARAIADREGFDLSASNVIAAHLGGGISLNLQSKGNLIDVMSADEGPFSTERAGGIPIYQAARIAKNEGIDALYNYEIGRGGLMSYTGSNDAIALDDRAGTGDREAAMLYDAMAYQVAKAIGSLATVVNGDVRAIILTGGMARSKRIVDAVRPRVEFIAPVYVWPGELEMEALAAGGMRVIRGEEPARNIRDDVLI